MATKKSQTAVLKQSNIAPLKTKPAKKLIG